MTEILYSELYCLWVYFSHCRFSQIGEVNCHLLIFQLPDSADISCALLLPLALWIYAFWFLYVSWIQFSCSVVSDSLRPHGLQHTMLPCPSSTWEACSNSCPSSQWCHPTLSSSVVPFSCLLPFPASGSFPMSQFFASGGQSIGVSASTSALPMNIQDWFPLGLTGLTSLQSKGLSRVFSSTTVQKHQFFSAQLAL